MLLDVVDLCGCGNNSVTENGMCMKWETHVEKIQCPPLYPKLLFAAITGAWRPMDTDLSTGLGLVMSAFNFSSLK